MKEILHGEKLPSLCLEIILGSVGVELDWRAFWDHTSLHMLRRSTTNVLKGFGVELQFFN